MSEELKIKRKNKILPYIYMIVFLVIVFGGIFGFKILANIKGGEIMSSYKSKPAVVNAEIVTTSLIHNHMDAIAVAQAFNSADLTTEASGVIISIDFKPGEIVKKGKKLLRLNTAVLNAELKQNIASEKLAKITYDRDLELLSKNAISQNALDITKSQYQQALAIKEMTEAKIDNNIITAPFDGKIGINKFDIGDYLQMGTTFVTLDSISPIYIDFTIPETDFSKIYKGQKIEVKSDSHDTSIEGEILAVDSRVSSKSLGIAVRGEILNTDAKIISGNLLNIKIFDKAENNLILIPENAINYTLYGDNVFVLTEKKSKSGKAILASYNDPSNPFNIIKTNDVVFDVKAHSISKENTENGLSIIKTGLKAGDIIVISGQNKLKDGGTATIANYKDIIK